MTTYLSYGFLILIGVLFFRRWMVFRAVKLKLPEYLKGGAIVVDVRTPEEFISGHVKGSINIPLHELAGKTNQLNKLQPILVCCRSGSRSGMAVKMLKKSGYDNAINAGPWNNLV